MFGSSSGGSNIKTINTVIIETKCFIVHSKKKLGFKQWNRVIRKRKKYSVWENSKKSVEKNEKNYNEQNDVYAK